MKTQSLSVLINRFTTIFLLIASIAIFLTQLFTDGGSAMFGLVLIASSLIVNIGSFLGEFTTEPK